MAKKASPKSKVAKSKPKLLSGPGMVPPRVKAIESAHGVKGLEAAGVYADQPRKYKMKRVFLVPEKKMVFVRFAEGYGEIDWPALFMRFAG